MAKWELFERLDNDFVYHAPSPGQTEKYQEIRATAHEFAKLLVGLVPEGQELSSALTKIDEAVFWGNAGIARQNQEV